MSHQPVPRTSAVLLGSRALGQFAIPATEDDAPSERRLIAPPEWDTAEERAEAQWLYEATHPPRPTLADLLAGPPQPGEWLIAWRCQEITFWVSTTDEALLFAPSKSQSELMAEIDEEDDSDGDMSADSGADSDADADSHDVETDTDDADPDAATEGDSAAEPAADSGDAEEPGIFAMDPHDAAVMTHQQAVALLPRLTQHLELEDDDTAWLEPVRREQALADFDSTESED